MYDIILLHKYILLKQQKLVIDILKYLYKGLFAKQYFSKPNTMPDTNVAVDLEDVYLEDDDDDWFLVRWFRWLFGIKKERKRKKVNYRPSTKPQGTRSQ